ncbi:MAG: hypothetical protein INH41_20825 [Myxococcaceae bacterium]|nr:hypothetical protein [Myxococcaceae bacterium]MCA3014836.1 hypothetical protein [Myxococcaceae bacterium]
MRGLQLGLLALVLLSAESVLVRGFGLEVARVDVTVVVVVFMAVFSRTVEGALTSFAVGYLLDVFTGRPTGLFPALAVLVFLVARGAAQLLDGKSRLGFALFTTGASAGHSLLAFLLTWLTSKSAEGRVLSLSGMPAQLLLTLAAAWLLFPLLSRLEPGERTEGGGGRLA